MPKAKAKVTMPSEVARYCTQVEAAYNELARHVVQVEYLRGGIEPAVTYTDRMERLKELAARYGLTNVLHVAEIDEDTRFRMHESLWDAFGNSRPVARTPRIPLTPPWERHK